MDENLNNIADIHQTYFFLTDIPEIQKFSFQDDIVEGKTASTTCFATADSTPLKFKWQKDDKDIDSSSNNVVIRYDNMFTVLIINPASKEDSGNYSCIASNSHGTAKYTAYLSVKGKDLSLIFLLNYIDIIIFLMF